MGQSPFFWLSLRRSGLRCRRQSPSKRSIGDGGSGHLAAIPHNCLAGVSAPGASPVSSRPKAPIHASLQRRRRGRRRQPRPQKQAESRQEHCRESRGRRSGMAARSSSSSSTRRERRPWIDPSSEGKLRTSAVPTRPAPLSVAPS